jgi:hypothetical protein
MNQTNFYSNPAIAETPGNGASTKASILETSTGTRSSALHWFQILNAVNALGLIRPNLR